MLAIWDFRDGPRTGIAEYNGRPHYFACDWDTSADDYSNVFSLTPIDKETLALALEQSRLWHAWERNFQAKRVAAATHPVLGGANSRYVELSNLLKAKLAASPHVKLQAVPTFSPAAEASSSPGVMRQLTVVWSNAT